MAGRRVAMVLEVVTFVARFPNRMGALGKPTPGGVKDTLPTALRNSVRTSPMAEATLAPDSERAPPFTIRSALRSACFVNDLLGQRNRAAPCPTSPLAVC